MKHYENYFKTNNVIMKKQNDIWVVNDLYGNSTLTKLTIPFDCTLYKLLLWNFFEVSKSNP